MIAEDKITLNGSSDPLRGESLYIVEKLYKFIKSNLNYCTVGLQEKVNFK